MATLTKTELKKYLKECIREMIKEGNPDLRALVNECVVSSLGIGQPQQQQQFIPSPRFAPQSTAPSYPIPQQHSSPYGNLVNQFAGNDPTQQLIFGDIANRMHQAELAERQALFEEQQYEIQQQQHHHQHQKPKGMMQHQPSPPPPQQKSRWAELAFNTQPLNTNPLLLQ